MKLLAFETATEACSVALWIDGAVMERFEIATCPLRTAGAEDDVVPGGHRTAALAGFGRRPGRTLGCGGPGVCSLS